MRKDCQCPRARHQHGTRQAYRRDECRCHACRLAYCDAALAYYYGGTWHEQELVPSAGVERRLQALHAIGWTWTALGKQMDCTGEAIRAIAVGAQRSATRPDTVDKIRALYDRLWNTHPLGAWADRSRRVATERGWLPPLAWDDDTIDDPNTEDYARNLHTSFSSSTTSDSPASFDEIAIEQAMDGRRVTLTRAETSEAIARLTAMGYSAEEIAQRLGMSSRNVVRFRSRAGETVAA